MVYAKPVAKYINNAIIAQIHMTFRVGLKTLNVRILAYRSNDSVCRDGSELDG